VLQFPDATVFGRLSDAVTLVHASRPHHQRCAGAANDRLVEDKTRVLGVALNDWNPEKAGAPTAMRVAMTVTAKAEFGWIR
jgi:hypothetical protein